jgi:hypothetical protein
MPKKILTDLDATGRTITATTFSGTASSVANSFVIRGDSGTTEGTNLYTFNGSSSKNINFVSGTGVSIVETAGAFTFNSAAATSTALGGIELFSDTTQTVAANAVTTTASRTYGLQINAAGQGVINVPWSDTDTNWYPTTFTWTGGTTAGPTGSLTGSGMSGVSYAAIPSASATASGIVTTSAQVFAGSKDFGTFSVPVTTDFYGSVTVNNGTGVAPGYVYADDDIQAGESLLAGSAIQHNTRTSTTTESANGIYASSSGFLSICRNGTPLIINQYSGSGTVYPVQFYYTGTASGRISMTSGGTPAFTSGSDYRMKENVVPITDAVERMKHAKAYTFNKIESVDPTMHPQTGFLAHELEEVHPEAVVGEKDAVDENDDPIYQEVMEAKIIPIMAQAINDLIGMVEALTARVELLENK